MWQNWLIFIFFYVSRGAPQKKFELSIEFLETALWTWYNSKQQIFQHLAMPTIAKSLNGGG